MGYKIAEVQLKRCINEIIDTYNLQKKRANKSIKKQFGIESNGYPAIIIKTP